MAKTELTIGGQGLPPALARAFAEDQTAKDDLSGGVQSSFAVMSFRSSKWRIKFQGNETLVTNDEGEPRASISVIVLNSLPKLSKIYYSKQYEEGSDDPPDCFSISGDVPDPGSPAKQSKTCDACPHNAWGSRVTAAGKKTKACQDSRRLAVVPDGDLDNEAYGGPMLLRVPAASLANLAEYGNKLQGVGWPYYGVVTKVGFDPDASYPKLTFKPVRALNEEEAVKVLELRTSDEVSRILSEAKDMTHDTAPKAPEGSTDEDNDDGFSALGEGPEKAKGRDISDSPEDREEKPKAPAKKAKKADANEDDPPKRKKQEPIEEAPVADDALEEELGDLLSGIDAD